MSYLVDVPVDCGGRLLLECRPVDGAGELQLASAAGHVVERAKQSLEDALTQLQPALHGLGRRMRSTGADEVTVEFGLTFGAECGLMVAKGSGEVHFAVTLTWHAEVAGAPPGQAAP